MNFNAVCRTCLTTDHLNPIFVKSADNKRYSAALFVTAGIKVNIGDGLPQQMCARCISFSNTSLEFRKQCKDAETRLLQVKQECFGAAETMNIESSEDFNYKNICFGLKYEEYTEIDNNDNITIKNEADNEIEDTRSDALNTAEEDPSKTFLLDYYCESSSSDNSCKDSVEKSKFYEGFDVTAKVHFQCEDCGQQFMKKRLLVQHLTTHNIKNSDEKELQYPSDENRFEATGVTSYTNKDSKSLLINQSDLTTQFQCDICEKQFMENKLLVRHIANHNVSSDNISKSVVMNQSDLTTHSAETFHTHRSDICPKKFIQQHNLIRHITNIHAESDDVDKSHNRLPGRSGLPIHVPIHTINKKVTCHVCKKQFKHKGALTGHLRSHTDEKLFNVCGKPFKQKTNLIRQQRTHTAEKPYPCGVCNRRFTSQLLLTRHMQTHRKEKTYKCDICQKEFTIYTAFILHVRIHTGEKTYDCDVCKKKFAYKSLLVVHMTTHTGEKLHKCGICQKEFAHKFYLTMHMRIHTGETTYDCDVCKDKFLKKAVFNKHMKTHTGEKLHRCDICEKAFNRKYNLIRHRTSHSSEKPFTCNICDKRYKNEYGCILHKRTHTGEKYICDVCGKEFVSKRSLAEHIKVHTYGQRFSCNVCKKRFTNKRYLKDHILIHSLVKSFICDMCGKPFARKELMNKHKMIHESEKRYSCDYCKKKIKHRGHLITHMRSHTGVRPYACSTCGKAFTRKDKLNEHTRIHTGEKRYACDMCPKRFTQSTTLKRHLILIHKREFSSVKSETV